MTGISIWLRISGYVYPDVSIVIGGNDGPVSVLYKTAQWLQRGRWISTCATYQDVPRVAKRTVDQYLGCAYIWTSQLLLEVNDGPVSEP